MNVRESYPDINVRGIDYDGAAQGWDRNPFAFTIYSYFFVGYDDEKAMIKRCISNGEKLCLILGPTGSGKTTFLRHMQSSFDDVKVLFLPKPPKEPEDWLLVFSPLIKRRLFRPPAPTLYTLPSAINKRLGKERLLLFVDECHEATTESLEWLRTLADHIENMTVVIAGLPVFENQLKERLETLMKRVSLTIRFTNLTKSETRELIKRRIEAAGGRDIEPFTSDAVQYIYERTSGFPREVLRLCSEIYTKAAEKNITTIDMDFLAESAKNEAQRVPFDSLSALPERQRAILSILASKGPLSPAGLADNFESEGYKSKGNAVRSMNNILKRLMHDSFVEREKAGKGYRYRVAAKYSTVLVNT